MDDQFLGGEDEKKKTWSAEKKYKEHKAYMKMKDALENRDYYTRDEE